MPNEQEHQLSRRERQIMEIVYRDGEVSARDVQAQLPKAPGYSAVRAMLAKLIDKGFLQHREEAGSYVYRAARDIDTARQGAISKLLSTFFAGNIKNAVTALLDLENGELSQQELDELAKKIEHAKKQRK